MSKVSGLLELLNISEDADDSIDPKDIKLVDADGNVVMNSDEGDYDDDGNMIMFIIDTDKMDHKKFQTILKKAKSIEFSLDENPNIENGFGVLKVDGKDYSEIVKVWEF